MKSQITHEFRDLFSRLPSTVQAAARRAYRLWLVNPSHPGLRFKPVHAVEPIYSVRIGIGWRALGLLDDDVMTWFWIGSHADYDKILRS